MGTRLQLHELLLTICDNVYFQPPENVKMRYPAILYEPQDEDRMFAGNNTYGLTDGYEVTIIDQDPDSPVRQKFRWTFNCSFTRLLRAEGLNHFLYTLYY